MKSSAILVENHKILTSAALSAMANCVINSFKCPSNSQFFVYFLTKS